MENIDFFFFIFKKTENTAIMIHYFNFRLKQKNFQKLV